MTKKTGNSFKDQGFQFIPIREAHIELIGAMMGREPPPVADVEGLTMVDRDFIPLGFALFYFEENCISAHAYFGRWLRTYPKDILRAIGGFFQTQRERGVTNVLAIADESIEGSTTLIRWMRGTPINRRHEFGEIYEIDLRRTLI